MSQRYAIGEFSKKTGFSIKALRHYQEVGLLIPCALGENNYRYYSQEQLAFAQRIKEYKDLGFALEEIKILLSTHQDVSLRKLLEQRLSSIEHSQQTLSEQKSALVSILTSLNTGMELSITQRSFIMEALVERGLEGLKRRGVIPSHDVQQVLENEIRHWSPIQGQVLEAVNTLIARAKSLNVMLGPGRGSSPASLLMFGEGYSPLNPMKFNLIPEIFSGAKYFWLDVEFSRSKEIGDLCKKISQELNYQIVAFKCPFLDILHRVQKKVGTIDFDSYADDSEVVLNAFKQDNMRGIWSYDWNPNYTAFQRMSKEEQSKFARNQKHFEEWIKSYNFTNIEEIITIGYLQDMLGQGDLDLYKSLKDSKVLYPFLKASSQDILKNAHGMLIWREDWLRLLCDNANISMIDAIKVFKAVANAKTDTPEYAIVMSLTDENLRNLLLEKAKTVFMKSHIVSGFWYIKRSAIMKTLWPEVYLATIAEWEQEKGIIWQEFGYEDNGERFFEA